jgi:hypothetical protein
MGMGMGSVICVLIFFSDNGGSSLIGPPVGGALYGRLGYKAPFAFGITFTTVDLVGRVLVDDQTGRSQS